MRINGNLDGQKYRQILDNYLLPFHREKLTPDYLFQQDSAGPHMAQVITGFRRRLPCGRKVKLPSWFSVNAIRQIATPSRSPDLSPIENGALVKC